MGPLLPFPLAWVVGVLMVVAGQCLTLEGRGTTQLTTRSYLLEVGLRAPIFDILIHLNADSSRTQFLREASERVSFAATPKDT